MFSRLTASLALSVQYMQTNVPDVFCGGDVCTFPLSMAQDQQVNIGHWQMAQAHGNNQSALIG